VNGGSQTLVQARILGVLCEPGGDYGGGLFAAGPRQIAPGFSCPHSGGRAWHWVVAEFDERLSDQVIPPVLSADLIAELRRGRDGLRLRIAVTVQAADIAEAIRVAWDVLENASEVGGFHLASATVDAGPAPLVLRSYRGLAHRSSATA